MLRAITLISLLGLALAAPVQNAANASAAALAAVDQGYARLGLELGGNLGFGINLTSSALLTATYSSGRVVNGRTYPPVRVHTEPAISFVPSNGFNTSATFTLTLSDANDLDSPNPNGNFRHWLVNGLSAGDPAANGSFPLTGGTTIQDYVGPAPPPGTGVHRYTFLLFEEPAGFAPPADLSSAGVAPGFWYVSDYVQQTGLEVVAATWFLATNNSAVATSSAPSSTLATAAIPTAAAASPSA